MTKGSSAALIEARGLTKHYDGFSLEGVDLVVNEGEVVGFVGQNGAGKSTTIKALLGLIRVDGGEGSVLGTPSDELTRASGAATKERVGVVFDTVSLPGHLRVADVGRIYASAFASWDAHRFSQLTRDLGLDPKKAAITDSAGVARCRVADLERIASSGMVPDSELRYLRHDYGIDVLVPDRFAFAEMFPDIPCDHMTIDDYMSLTLKGGVR